MNLLRKYVIPSCCFCGAVRDNDLANIATEQEDDSIRQFGSSEINSRITHSSVIAEGGFSTVYLSCLPNRSSYSPAAFKAHEPNERLYRMFHQELDIFRHVSHPNIVRLFGYSDDNESSGVLLFEHVPNGTLHGMLLGRATLSWSKRMSIAFQLAMALDYLHDLQIIHGDIKASNVLLDHGLNPKLCDFGFARKGFSSTVARSANPMMIGSPGYVDPHYLRTGLVSKKSDVYSFGVLILELITGMEAFSSEKSRMLTTVMRPRLQEMQCGEMVDVRMGGEYDKEEVLIMAGIAAQCIGANPSLRPAMGEILKIMTEKVPSALTGGKKNI